MKWFTREPTTREHSPFAREEAEVSLDQKRPVTVILNVPDDTQKEVPRFGIDAKWDEGRDSPIRTKRFSDT
jgi:hypothetical protein